MTWPIRMVSAPTFDRGPDGKNGFQRLEVGDMWFAPYLLDPSHAYLFGPEGPAPNYVRDWHGKRAPLVVRLPGPFDFAVDGRAWQNGMPYGDGWVVTGDPPLITVSPSINIGGLYHGYIRNGVITDDVEGRTFR